MSKKVLIGIIAVIAILVIAGAAMAGSSSNNNDDSEKTHNGECKYTATEVDSYTYKISSYTYVKVPDAGKKFIRVTGTLTNNQDKYTMSSNPYNFQLVCDGLSYNYEYYNYDYVDIGKGYSASIDLCFQVPDTASEIELKWTGLIKDVNMVKQ